MSRIQQHSAPAARSTRGGSTQLELTAPLRQFRQQLQGSPSNRRTQSSQHRNVSEGERMVSAAAGAILALQGLARRDITGVLIATVGGALVYRGATGHCSMYQTLGVNTAQEGVGRQRESSAGVHIVESFLINKSPEELYSFWRNFENFPQFMSHLESVQKIDDKRSHWVAKAPMIYGGSVEWDAEITADEPNSRIAWRAMPEGDVQHQGSVRFQRALGDRGTMVHVDLDYHPPAGQVGRWVAKLFGEEPEMQIRDDLRKVKRLMEVGEVPTIEGQPRGTCMGRGRRVSA
jgi:uncharacterized membrane protein